MTENHCLLTFEMDIKNEVLEVHCNERGLEKLKIMIDALAAKKQDHVHLMTKEWGGNELSGEKQSQENQLVNHVKIFKWIDA